MATSPAPYDLPEAFRDFAMMPKFDDDIDFLATLAPEDWDYHNTPSTESHPILRNYIKYTYRRIAQEKKVAVTQDEKHACWNTGLVTPHQEPIFILFEENKFTDRQCYWHFWKFARRGVWELNRFPVLPEMAHYYEDPSSLVYDTRKELRANIEHIIADNRRHPCRKRCQEPFFTLCGPRRRAELAAAADGGRFLGLHKFQLGGAAAAELYRSATKTQLQEFDRWMRIGQLVRRPYSVSACLRLQSSLQAVTGRGQNQIHQPARPNRSQKRKKDPLRKAPMGIYQKPLRIFRSPQRSFATNLSEMAKLLTPNSPTR